MSVCDVEKDFGSELWLKMYLLGMLKKILTNQKTLHIMKRLAVKSQNEGATSDAETLHNMKRLFIRASMCTKTRRFQQNLTSTTILLVCPLEDLEDNRETEKRNCIILRFQSFLYRRRSRPWNSLNIGGILAPNLDGGPPTSFEVSFLFFSCFQPTTAREFWTIRALSRDMRFTHSCS